MRAEESWARQDRAWRDPREVVSGGSSEVESAALRGSVRGEFWPVLERLGVTLLVTREYEHLLLALSAGPAGSKVSFLRLPHPCGIAVDHRRRRVHVASTRNPNQIVTLAPVEGLLARSDVIGTASPGRILLPVASRYLPGCLYLHDLAMVAGRLYGNAVGMNAIVRIDDDGSYALEWWPKSVETAGVPATGRNYLQLNSIAAGPTLRRSFFTASSAKVGKLFPGDVRYPVDRTGVLFSGMTREPVVHGLTRPHSARLGADGVWLANSGYGELGVVRSGRYEVVRELPGWTRGLCLVGDVALVGTSRVLPRFRQYAPGLDPQKCVCGIHAVDRASGRVLGSLSWRAGNQIFAIEALPSDWATELAFAAGGAAQRAAERDLFYRFRLSKSAVMPGST